MIVKNVLQLIDYSEDPIYKLNKPTVALLLELEHKVANLYFQVQSTQQALQGVANTQVTSAPPAHLSQQQQQIFQQQQQQAQQLLHQQLQQLQPLKVPATSGNHTIAINKPQVVSEIDLVNLGGGGIYLSKPSFFTSYFSPYTLSKAPRLDDAHYDQEILVLEFCTQLVEQPDILLESFRFCSLSG